MLLIAKWTFGLGPFADLRRSRGIFVFDGRAIAAERGFCLLLGSPLARFAPCPCRKLNPYVLMVQSAKHRSTFDAPDALNDPSNGRILP
jgi:hypothetical protein